MIGIIIINNANLMGRNLFHVRYIKLSYRIRGKVARIQTNRVAINIVFRIRNVLVPTRICPEKNTMDKSLIIKMLAYSAIKIKANIPPLYSTLKPETNSDSPSAKSNGVRFVSARLVMNQKINIIININIGQDNIETVMTDMSIFLWIISAEIKISDIDTS